MQRLTEFAIARPRLLTLSMVLSTLVLALLAAAPSLSPATFPFLHGLEVDTDPENMLDPSEPVRQFHHEMKERMALSDMIVVGIDNERHPQGAFNAATLAKVHELTEFAKTLHWPAEKDPSIQEGVKAAEILSLSTVDRIEQAGPGSVRFDWLMKRPPADDDEAREVFERAKAIDFFEGTLFSPDGTVAAIYLPLTRKDVSHRVYVELNKKIATFADDGERFFVTGLPVAEDTFGVEMFVQMAISAPLAMLVIFALMYLFFRNLRLIVSPMIVAMVAVISTMALLVATGNTVHIMSSMIPIFIMPIAVLDAVHILSEFFDRYQETRDRKGTIRHVMGSLSAPMLFTSLTTTAGFASLALTPIPPVQVFGVFVALGVMLAWFWTVTFIPAYIALLPERALDDFGLAPEVEHSAAPVTFMDKLLVAIGRISHRGAHAVVAVTALILVVAVYGISQIRINDNPIKWFEKDHPIRRAADVLNSKLGGTYMAYLAIEPGDEEGPGERDVADLVEVLRSRGEESGLDMAPVIEALAARARSELSGAPTHAAWHQALRTSVESTLDELAWEEAEPWEEALTALDTLRQRGQVFKNPEVLEAIGALQEELLRTGIVGSSTSLADFVKTIHRELYEGDPAAYRVPDTPAAVAQTILTFQNSHRGNDLWHFVTPDYRTASLWVQLNSGDNGDMIRVVDAVDAYLAAHPLPFGLRHRWYGLTYINVVWQEKMVRGMLLSLAGGGVVVLLMMIFLFRSTLWGILSMVPLSISIALIYGSIGLIGKDYDMPIAVLSALSLGLAVDYAIHFLARSRSMHDLSGSWSAAVAALFGEPARAILRNVIVIGMGFLPLLAAPLVPYQTVGLFIAAILFTAGVASLFLLPAALTLFEGLFFPARAAMPFWMRLVDNAFVAALVMLAIDLNASHFLDLSEGQTLWFFALGFPLLTFIGFFVHRRHEPPIPVGGEEEDIDVIEHHKSRVSTMALIGLVTLAALSATGVRAEPTVDEIVAKANHMSYYQGTDGRAQVSMVITDPQGRKQRRQFTVLRKDLGPAEVDDKQRYYVLFHRPADVAKTAFLVWKNPAGDDDRWLYLPALDLVKRIAASDKRTSFVGSHFYYEDISGRRLDEDERRLVETTKSTYVVEGTPKDPDSVEFASYKVWIHKGTFLPIKMEYYDGTGEPIRRYEALEVKEIDGHQTVTAAKMTDLASGGSTTVRYRGVTYDIGVPDEIFSERYLRNPPREYLR